ncbi:MAG: glutathione S-transferase [Alphaproteobacteria bacterium]|nr:glutathione S-transferase [Alphaproteobacteria bacterium]
MIKLYRHPLSGHSHRVELFLSLIGQDHELVEVDLLKGEQKGDNFLALNPFGKVPVIDDGSNGGPVVWDSNAILVYLARRYAKRTWYPDEPTVSAEIQKWLSVAAGDINNGPATARLVTVFGAGYDPEQAKSIAYGLFDVLELHLTGRAWLADANPTIADVAGYSYIAHAPEGDVSLKPYPAVRAWLARIEALPGFIPMQKTAVVLAA